MTKFVIYTGEDEGYPPSLEVVSYPTQHDFLVDLLGLDGDEEEEMIDYTDEQLIAEFEATNNQPFIMGINCDTNKVIIGEKMNE